MYGSEHGSSDLHRSTSGYMPRAPPNDPERHGNIWQQHERLQADYQQLLDQNNKLTSERTHYQNDKRQTENAVGVLLQENHSLHQQVSGKPHAPPTTTTAPTEHDGADASDHSAHRSYNHNPSHRFQRFNSFKSDSMVSPRAALQSIFPGKFNGYDHSPDTSSQAESYDQQYPAQQHQQHQQYFNDYSQSGSPGSAINQLGQLRSELASKDEQIVQLQHTVQGMRGKLQSLQYTVDDADAHRRQVQVHNGELQTQIDSLLSELEGLRQGHSWGGDPDHVHQLTQANVELSTQLSELSQRLESHDAEPQGLTEQEAAQLHDRVAQLESDNADLTLKSSQLESRLRHDHHRELRRIESEKENRLLELKGEHETLISLLTEQNERLEAELRDAAETARAAATAAATSPMASASGSPTTPRDLSAEDERKVQGLKATILQLVEENKSLTRLHEHNRNLKQEVQQMMKVKSEREDLHQENSKLHSELRKLQRDLDARSAQADEKLQEQLQILKSDKADLQEQLQQAQRAAPAGPAPLQADLKKEGQEQGYTNTWKLVDQLRNQNRLLIAELSELRGGKESTSAGADSSRATSGKILRRLGLKKTKDRSLASNRSSTTMPDPAQLDGDMQSNSSFNEDQSQTASVEHPSEIESQEMQQLLDTAEERMSQAEQRALKAEESAQAQEGLISQLCDENLKLGEEIHRLNSSMRLVKELSDENSRLLRDNKRANESLDGMVKDIAELNNRLLNIAFQSPEDGGDIFDDAFADPAELAERTEKRRKAALEKQAFGGDGDRAAAGMDGAMKRRQEATAAEVKAREEALAKDEERHQQLKEESKKQLDTYERVKDKVNSTSAPFSLARQRLQRANSGLNGRPASDSKAEPSTSTKQAEAPPIATKSPFQNVPRPAATTPERVRAQRLPVPSPVVDLTPSKQTPVPPPVAGRGPPARQNSVKAPASPPLAHPAVLNSSAGSSRQQSDSQKTTGQAGEGALGGPVTPERMPSGRMHSGRISPVPATNDGEPGRNLKPIQTARSLSREGSLTRSESGNDRLRQEADASRAEIWRKIQAAKLNNSKKHQEPGSEASTASPMSPTQGLVTSGPAPARAQPPAPAQSFTSRPVGAQSPAQPPAQPAPARQQPAIAQQGSARDQVDQAYLQYGPDHNIVAFMQSLGYSEFTAASADEEKMSQFKRALKLTRPAFAATRSPMQQELANAVYAKLQSWVDQFVYKR